MDDAKLKDYDEVRRIAADRVAWGAITHQPKKMTHE